MNLVLARNKTSDLIKPCRHILISMSLVWLIAGCSSIRYTQTPALVDVDRNHGYRMNNLKPEYGGNEVLIFLSLSGGGMRASAFSYGVLETLDTHTFNQESGASLLDEVDLVNAVSGGSLVAAVLTTRGTKGFRSFEPVLYQGLQGSLIRRWISPRGLYVTSQPMYGRGDLLQEVLDKKVFFGATYGDLVARGHRPMMMLRATDMNRGEAFDFSQLNFNRFCSDLNAVPIARAVAASMSVPVALSPITIEGHAENCKAAVSSGVGNDTRKFIHLLDGGLVDNLGVRGPVDFIDRSGGFNQAVELSGIGKAHHVVFIVVNSEAVADYQEDTRPETPGIIRGLKAWIDVPIRTSTNQNIHLLKQKIEDWQFQTAANDEITPRFYYIEVNLRGTEDNPVSRKLNAIPTALRLPKADIDLLRESARQQLESNPQFEKLLQELHH
jgi:NTE family protein